MDSYGSGYTGRNRSAQNGGPSGVQRSYATQLREHEALFSTYEHLQGLPRGDSALTLLRKVASMVKPIMRKRDWKVQVLAEFLPAESNLLGLNINKGYKICIRLRYHNNPDLFLPIEQIVDTLLHELSHNVWGDHDANFHRLWDELRDEYETLLMKGFTGEGFLGRGQRLGGRASVPRPQEVRRLARVSAEQRQLQAGLSAGSGQRLGGNPLHRGQDVREVIAGQVLRRNTINRGCGSLRKNASAIADVEARPTFKTAAEEDDANDRAIAEALFDLMEAEETAKLNGTYKQPPVDGGLAWSKEDGLYGPGAEESWNLPTNSMPTEEEQMRWALEESQRLTNPHGHQDYGGLPPESLVSPISPLTPENSMRARRPSLAARLRNNNPSPVSPVVSQRNPSLNRQPVGRSSSLASTTMMPILDISEPFNPDEWVCEICTCVNPMQFLACDACGSERSSNVDTGAPQRNTRPLSIVPSPTTSIVPSPVSSRNESLGWNCQNCGAFMEHQWWTCSACGMMKASS